jgi:hypothetical protein
MNRLKIITIILLTWTSLSFGQNPSKIIFYFKPYTDSIETNLYKDTLVKFDYETQYYNLESANINIEVENAFKHNDFRIIALSGACYVFPGLDGGYETQSDGSKVFIGLSHLYEPHFKKYGFKVIKGTSDAINGDDLPLQSIASDFARKYNALLFEKIENKEK